MKRGDLIGSRPSFTAGFVVKLLLILALDALVLSVLPRMIEHEAWVALAASVAATVALNVVYFSSRMLPAKYLLPATFLLLVFAVYPVVYTIYVSFTNYSASHNITKEQAIDRIVANSETPQPDAPRYQARAITNDAGSIALLLTDEDGNTFIGTADGLEAIDPSEVVEVGIGQVTVREYRSVTLGEAVAREDEFLGIRVPTERGSIRLNTISSASLVERTLEYDAETDTMRNVVTGDVYRIEEGAFVNADATPPRLTPGWRVVIGPDNFVRAFTSPAIRGPFLRAFVWNYVFAILTVLLQFVLGLCIALALNHPRLRLKRVYRSLLVIPFALPSYLTSLIWAGLLNTQFGQVNQLLNANINWLNDPNLAKVSILLVTMWLGFSYFFLVSTGALTAIPAELTEAAEVDGASPWYAFRSVKLPLLLTTLSPLLIASFAFNFNNFNAIYLLTRGGPPIQGAQTPVGHTDILITYTYRLAFESGRGADYAFASAISIVIFVMIMAISAYSFRLTRTLEQVR